MRPFRVMNFLSGVLVGAVLFSGGSYASSTIKLIVDGKEIQSDVPPQIVNGKTMVPARYLAEALGAEVKWDNVNQAVIVTSKESSQKLDAPENKETFIYKDQAFTVSLPIEWKDKIRVEKKSNETQFYYQPADPSKQPDYLFGIDLIQKKEWDESGYMDIGFYTLLEIDQDKVYALHKPSETPYANYPDSIEYQEVGKMLTNIKESIQFKLVK